MFQQCALQSSQRFRRACYSRTTMSKSPTSKLLAIAPATTSRALEIFSDHTLEKFQLAVLGDLHLHPDQEDLFKKGQTQLNGVFSADGYSERNSRLLQLGDLGSSKVKSGSRSCFELAQTYLEGFSAPHVLITGNHDLEGEEFDTDAENLVAWQEVFQQPHNWHAKLGPLLLVGLSTTRYRSNAFSHHEVYIDEEQRRWLEEVLQAHPNEPVAVFSHAPPMGCGLKVLEELHVKNRCAWLNHSEDPGWFINLVTKHPQIKLWFSAHFHLSHNYPDSVSLVGGTAFVQTGVMGACGRDGFRQSRLLRGTATGFELLTVDHDSDHNFLRVDLAGSWAPDSVPQITTPEDELLCDPDKGWLCSQWDCSIGQDGYGVRWFQSGPNSLLAAQDNLIVEYDMALQSPMGVVATGVKEETDVQLLRADGTPSTATDGSDTAVLRLVDPQTGAAQDIKKNDWGGFYQIFQPNKWRIKQEKMAVMPA